MPNLWKVGQTNKPTYQIVPHMKHHINIHLRLKPYKYRRGWELGFADPANRNQHEKRVHKTETRNREEEI